MSIVIYSPICISLKQQTATLLPSRCTAQGPSGCSTLAAMVR